MVYVLEVLKNTNKLFLIDSINLLVRHRFGWNVKKICK